MPTRYKLRSFEITPPGGYVYIQQKGITRKFASVPLIEDQAQAVYQFRKANGLPRASLDESLADIENFTCYRLGGMIEWCYDTDGSNAGAPNPVLQGKKPCKGCGVALFT